MIDRFLYLYVSAREYHLMKLELLFFFYERGPHNVEASQLIYRANQWNGFYMIRTSVMSELMSFCRGANPLHKK